MRPLLNFLVRRDEDIGDSVSGLRAKNRERSDRHRVFKAQSALVAAGSLMLLMFVRVTDGPRTAVRWREELVKSSSSGGSLSGAFNN